MAHAGSARQDVLIRAFHLGHAGKGMYCLRQGWTFAGRVLALAPDALLCGMKPCTQEGTEGSAGCRLSGRLRISSACGTPMCTTMLSTSGTRAPSRPSLASAWGARRPAPWSGTRSTLPGARPCSCSTPWPRCIHLPPIHLFLPEAKARFVRHDCLPRFLAPGCASSMLGEETDVWLEIVNIASCCAPA